MVHLIRNNTPYAVLLLLIFGLVTQSGNLLHPVAAAAQPEQLLYSLIVAGGNKVLHGSPMGWTVLNLVLLFVQALYVNSMAMRHKLFPKPGYVPAYLLLLYAALSPGYGHFSEALVSNFFLIGGLDCIMRFGHPAQPRRHIFNAGFLLAAAALVQFSAVFYVLLMVMALVLLRPFHPGEWMSALLGLLTPLYFMAGALFLMDEIHLLPKWPSLGVALPRQMSHPAALLAAIGGVLVLVIAGLYVLQDQMGKSTIYVRRGWGAMVTSAIVSIPVAAFASRGYDTAWMALAPSFALVAAPPFNVEKPRRFANFIFYFSLALVVFCHAAG